MAFWVLQDGDMPSQGRADGCRLEPLDPFNTKPSDAKCPRCGAPLEAAFWVSPHRARVSSRECGDLIPGVGFDLVISNRAWRALTDGEVAGLPFAAPLATEPVTSQPYFVTRPRVTVTRLDEVQSGVKWRRPPSCDECRLGVRKSVDSIVLDESTWDGSDIFVPSGLYGVKLVTARFVDCIERSGLTGFRFVRAEDYSEPARP